MRDVRLRGRGAVIVGSRRTTHACTTTGMTRGGRTVALEIDVLAKNDGLAAVNREWFARRGSSR